jgi:hypothetical protein
MERYYYNNETDTVEEIDYIRSDYYEVFGNDYDSFGDYLNACMAWNNGALTPVSVKLKYVKRELNRKLELARKYGYEEYEEEILALLEQMDKYGKLTRERA